MQSGLLIDELVAIEDRIAAADSDLNAGRISLTQHSDLIDHWYAEMDIVEQTIDTPPPKVWKELA